MNTRDLKKLASRSAVALGFAFYANAACAVGFTGDVLSDGSNPFTLGASTTVNNLLSIVVTNDMKFGTFGTVKDPANVATATATMDTANTFTGSAGAAKVIDAFLGDHQAATITVIAFNSTRLFADYSGIVNLIGQGAFPADTLTITSITDNLNSPTTGTGGAAGSFTAPAAFVEGKAVTDITGNLVFKIGGVLTTAAATTYHSQNYQGSFTLTLSY